MKQSHSLALPTQPASGTTSSAGPTARAPGKDGKKRARDNGSGGSSDTRQHTMAPLTATELEAATEAMLNQYSTKYSTANATKCPSKSCSRGSQLRTRV